MGTSMRGLIPTLWDAWNLGLGTQWFWLGLVALTMPRRDGDDIPTSFLHHGTETIDGWGEGDKMT